MSLELVNLGLPKSGTTTLARALRRAGLRTADHRVRRRQTPRVEVQGQYVADLLYRGYFETGDPGALLGDFAALSEISLLDGTRSIWPQSDLALIDALRRSHPRVRFLALRRDAFETSQSMLAWSNLGLSRLPRAAVPGLPPGFGETSKERQIWIDGHYATLRRYFARDPGFLEVDIDDPATPDRIGAFLGRRLPWWGRANANPLRAASGAS